MSPYHSYHFQCYHSILSTHCQETRTTCGVIYEVVMGIPKSEGMRPPPEIPANPSIVELDEDESAVDKFKEAMGNISSILSLDRLKQVWYLVWQARPSLLRSCANEVRRV